MVTVRDAARSARAVALRTHHAVAGWIPATIQPRPRQLTIAVTAHCNLRCEGCNYPKGFMAGHSLSLETIRTALDDAHDAGFRTVRFYGGEPLLHPDLARMVEHAIRIGLKPYVTTNGTHLKSKGAALYEAGLRLASIGFYGVGDSYDAYVHRSGHYRRLEQSLSFIRSKYGNEFELQLNYVLMRPTCSLAAVEAAWEFALRFDMYFHVDLVSFSAPFFNDGIDGSLSFRAADEPAIRQVAARMEEMKRSARDRFVHSIPFIRSIPDWLLLREAMRIPCDAYDHMWIGADGTIQLCDVAFPLGNLHRQRLKDVLFSAQHKTACSDGFALNCPNCMCKVETRISKHWPSAINYGAGWRARA
jgi:cyclic pyranopterin phosphate synthase